MTGPIELVGKSVARIPDRQPILATALFHYLQQAGAQQAGAQALTSSQHFTGRQLRTLWQRTLRTLQQGSQDAGAQAFTSWQAFGASQALGAAQHFTGSQHLAASQHFTGRQLRTLWQRTLQQRVLQQGSQHAGAQAFTSWQAFGASQALGAAQHFTSSQHFTGRQLRTLWHRTLRQRGSQTGSQAFGAQAAGAQAFGAQAAGAQAFGAQAAGAQAFGAAQQAGSQQPLPSNKPAWALETLTTATNAATANAGNKIRRYMEILLLLEKPVGKHTLNSVGRGVRSYLGLCYRRISPRVLS